MAVLGFKSVPEFNAYITFVLLGMSIMMVVSAITSAPDFVTQYYRFATGNPDAICETPVFWNNANTFYNVGTYVTQLCTEPLALAPFMRKIPLRLRMLVALSIPFGELLLMILIPTITIPTQNGAIAVLMVVSVLGGFSKAICNSTTNALVGPFPTKFMNGMLWGLSVAALFMSILQCSLKGVMGNTFQDSLTLARVYFGIAMGLQVIAIVLFILLYRNPFAHIYIAEFRVLANRSSMVQEEEGEAQSEENDGERNVEDDEPVDEEDEVDPNEKGCTPERRIFAMELEQTHPSLSPVDLHVVLGKKLDPQEQRRCVVAQVISDEDGESGNIGHSASVMNAVTDADFMRDTDQTGEITSSQQMMNTNALSVFKKVYTMLLTCFFVYFTSLLLFPGLFFSIPTDNDWFITLIVLFFNLGDFLSRIVLMVRQLRPAPKVCVIGALGRLLVIPLLVVCVRGLIPGVWLPYILVLILGLTNGYYGAMAMIYSPRTPSLGTAGERAIAAILSGIFLQLGLCLGSNCALAVNIAIK